MISLWDLNEDHSESRAQLMYLLSGSRAGLSTRIAPNKSRHLTLCQEAHGVKRGAEVAAVEGGAWGQGHVP